jgi:hypothetical protein
MRALYEKPAAVITELNNTDIIRCESGTIGTTTCDDMNTWGILEATDWIATGQASGGNIQCSSASLGITRWWPQNPS